MPSPLHPAVVHFPLVFAVLVPLLAVIGLILTRRPGAGRAPWGAVAAFAVLVPLTAWAAVETGGDQADVVERVVPEAALEGHEELAEGFLAASAIVAIVALAGLLPGRAGLGARWVTIPASALILALAFRVGDSGGRLVYTHGAASAYVRDGAWAPGAASDALGERAGDEAAEEEHEADQR